MRNAALQIVGEIILCYQYESAVLFYPLPDLELLGVGHVLPQVGFLSSHVDVDTCAVNLDCFDVEDRELRVILIAQYLRFDVFGHRDVLLFDICLELDVKFFTLYAA